jgi:hypothetical protein
MRSARARYAAESSSEVRDAISPRWIDSITWATTAPMNLAFTRRSGAEAACTNSWTLRAAIAVFWE